MQGKFLENESSHEVITHEDGKKEIRIQCREAFVLPIGSSALRAPESRDRTPDQELDATDGDERGYKKDEDERVAVVEGIASSTSVDFYGTEMSSEALTNMAKQMTRGIPLLPRHQSLTGGGTAEWDEVIGRTVGAELMPQSVDAPAEASEPQYVLKSTSVLYKEEPLAQALMRRLSRGEPIGQSIGGWFTDIRVLQDEEGEISRVIVDEVELDHLAITRAPANPDSKGLYTLRSRAEEFAKSISSEDGHIEKMDDLYDETEIKEKEVTEVIVEETDDQEPRTEPCCDMDHTEDQITRDSKADMDLALAPEDMEWDWSVEAQNELLYPDGEDSEPDWALYSKAHFYCNLDADKATKDAYKLPFAKMIDGELKAVWKGVSSAMAALNGARGGVDIPEDEMDMIYDKISEYYRRFDKEAPPLERSALEQIDTDSSNGVTETRELDESIETVYDSSEDALGASDDTPADAQRGAIPEPLSTIKDEPMTNEDLEKISELISRSVGGLVERVSSIEENLSAKTESAPAVEPPDEPAAAPAESPELIEMRAKLVAAERRLARLAEYGVRHGIHSTAQVVEPARGPGADSEWRSLLDAHNEEAGGAGHLATFVERSIEDLAETSGKNGQSRRDLEETLRKGLRCAIADGLLNSSAPSSWR